MFEDQPERLEDLVLSHWLFFFPAREAFVFKLVPSRVAQESLPRIHVSPKARLSVCSRLDF